MYSKELNIIKTAIENKLVSVGTILVSENTFKNGKAIVKVQQNFLASMADGTVAICNAVCSFVAQKNANGAFTDLQHNRDFIKNPVKTNDYPYKLQVCLSGKTPMEFDPTYYAELKPVLESFLEYENCYYHALNFINDFNNKVTLPLSA